MWVCDEASVLNDQQQTLQWRSSLSNSSLLGRFWRNKDEGATASVRLPRSPCSGNSSVALQILWFRCDMCWFAVVNDWNCTASWLLVARYRLHRMRESVRSCTSISQRPFTSDEWPQRWRQVTREITLELMISQPIITYSLYFLLQGYSSKYIIMGQFVTSVYYYHPCLTVEWRSGESGNRNWEMRSFFRKGNKVNLEGSNLLESKLCSSNGIVSRYK